MCALAPPQNIRGKLFDMIEEIEIWVDIPEYIGLYQVSSLGNIRSLNYNKTGKIKLLKFNRTKAGYALVRLYKAGKQKPALVSRLVCAAFHDNPDNFPCVNHKDENKLNNRADNLEWCTYRDNVLYGTHGKRMIETRNRKHGPKAEKPVIQLSLDGQVIEKFCSIQEAGRETGTDRRKISACCNGQRKSHGGYRWTFQE